MKDIEWFHEFNAEKIYRKIKNELVKSKGVGEDSIYYLVQNKCSILNTKNESNFKKILENFASDFNDLSKEWEKRKVLIDKDIRELKSNNNPSDLVEEKLSKLQTEKEIIVAIEKEVNRIKSRNNRKQKNK